MHLDLFRIVNFIVTVFVRLNIECYKGRLCHNYLSVTSVITDSFSTVHTIILKLRNSLCVGDTVTAQGHIKAVQ